MYPGEPFNEVLDDWDEVIERVTGERGGVAQHVPLSWGLLLTCCGSGPQVEATNHTAQRALRELTRTPLPAVGVLALSAVAEDGTPAPLTAELRNDVLDAAQLGALIARHRR